jgi:glycosyltransferase involved in cell wall biosynthesis
MSMEVQAARGDRSEVTFSIITVCYNSASTIADTLRSIAEQTYPHIQHIIVDGASTDDTLRVIQSHSKRVAHLISEPDRGIYDAMNKGIGVASGDIIGFLNADDFYAEPDAVAAVASMFDDPGVDACYGDLQYVRPDDLNVVVRHWRSSPFRPGLFLQGWVPPHPTFFVRRRAYVDWGRFDLQFRIAADIELMMRFLEVHGTRARYLPKVLVKMRMGGTTNKSWRNVLQQNREIWHALKMHGLQPSLPNFVMGKLLSRSRQYLFRAT